MTAQGWLVDCGGVRLHAREEGQGPPVLVLHGFTGAIESMEGVASALRDRHRVVRVDLLGHGASDAPRDPALYAVERCGEQLGALLDALAIRRAHVVGYSMGGRAGLALAALQPARVASLVAIGARAGFADPAERAARVAGDEALADAIEREGVAAFVDRWMAQPLFASQRRLGADALAAARAQRLRNRAHGLAASLRGMGAGAQTPLHDRLTSLDVPALFVAGAEDARFAAIARELAASLPRADVALVPDAGHAAHLENPGAFAALLREFLARAQARRAPSASPAATEIHA